MKKVFLKKNKERAVLMRHPWIFSGAIERIDGDIGDGDIVSVCDRSGARIACGYYNSKTRISVRLLSFGEQEITADYLRGLISSAVQKRADNPLLRDTDSFRLVFSEGDFLPGLIVDSYRGHLVIQCLTLGIEKMKDTLVLILTELLRPESIYERSDHEGRKLEGLRPAIGRIYGNTPEEIIIHENGMAFSIDVARGQKTGFYLDQRENRGLVKSLAGDKSVLNLFSYTGGFSVAAAMGGARRVISVDASGDALDTARKNMALNNADIPAEFTKADVFEYVRKGPVDCGLIVIDPPALARNRASVHNACRGYKELHLQIAARCPANTLVLTCSCSRFIDMKLFQMVVFEAFADAGRTASIIGKHGQPPDHPTSIFCPETEYLKTILLRVE